MVWIVGIAGALLLHVAFILFGGLIFPREPEHRGRTQQVELLSEDAAAQKEKDKDKVEPQADQDPLKAEAEEPPDSAEMLRNLELSATADAPALEAASLASIEQALSGQGGGGGDFGTSLSLASGGRIGGIGKPGAMDDGLESAFSLTEIDQKPRSIFQAMPLYPAEMRGRKVQGFVSVIFVVDAEGRVTSPRVEKSSHPAFERPGLEAVRQWKFEPALKAGKRVPCKMRAPIRFQQG